MSKSIEELKDEGIRGIGTITDAQPERKSFRLQKSTEYKVTVGAELRTVDGKGLADPFSWSFINERIKVKQSLAAGYLTSATAPG